MEASQLFSSLVQEQLADLPWEAEPLDESTVEYIATLYDDEAISPAERIETIKGLVLLQVSPEVDTEERVERSVALLDRAALDYMARVRPSCLPSPILRTSATKASPQFAPLDAADSAETWSKPRASLSFGQVDDDERRKALLAAYGSVAEDETLVPSKRAEEQEAVERQALVEDRLRGLSLKKKQRKKAAAQYDGDPLLRPNLNADVVAHQQKLQREAAGASARAKAERDKQALLKQRADQAQKKEDARRRAAKGERRA